MNKPKLSLTGLRAKLNNLAEGRLRNVLVKLERVPPLETALLRLRPLKYPVILIAGLLAADLAMQGVGTFLDDTKPPPPPKPRVITETPYVRNQSSYEGIISRNAFCPGCPVPDMKIRAMERPKDCNKAQPIGSDLKLIGTIVLSDPRYSVATVIEGTSESSALLVGDSFRSYGKVLEIRRNRVCFLRDDNSLGYIDLPEEQIKFGQPLPTAFAPSLNEGITRVSDTDVQIKQSTFVDQLNDPNILYAANTTPQPLPDGNLGFRLVSFKPGSVYEHLGLKVGDVFAKIDGSPITMTRVQEMYSNARSLNQLNIEVLRNGVPVQLSFKVTK